MTAPFAEELHRLEGPPFDGREAHETDWRAAMWRRSYCVSLNAVKSLEARLKKARLQSWDGPMVFFYPESDNQ